MTRSAEPTDRTATTPHTVSTELRFLKGTVPAEGGRVQALLRVLTTTPTEQRTRTAIDLAVVLDRSGSMRGEPLRAARAAAHDAIDLMEDGDRIALVTFDSDVEVVFPASDVRDRAPLHQAVERIDTRGMTALHAGWVEGTQQLVDLLDDDRSARVLLLTDGMANVGVTSPAQIAADVARLKALGITTSTVGLGRQFQEDLLATLAHAGGGRFAYAETPADLEGLIAAELIAADATAGRDLRARWQLNAERVAGLRAVGTYRDDDGELTLPDLFSGVPLEIPLLFDLRALDAGADVTLGTIDLSWLGAGGQRLRVSVPIVTDALQPDAYEAAPDDVDVVVAHVLTRAGDLYTTAMKALDQLDLRRAQTHLRALEAALAKAPNDSRLEHHATRLAHAREALLQRDTVLARKRMHADRERAFSRFDAHEMRMSPVGLEKQRLLEERLGLRGAATALPLPAAPQVFDTVTLPRSNGAATTVRIMFGDITTVPADALINPSNTHLHGSGRTIDGAVHRVGGRELTRECRAIGRIELTHAVATRGHNLPVDYVIHVAGPTYAGNPNAHTYDHERDLDLLEKTYRAALSLARQMRLAHVTLPAIGTGAKGYPRVEATQRAVAAIVRELDNDDAPTAIDIVLADQALGRIYQRVLGKARDARVAA